ncbi:hypothetical protein [Phormidesmis sp. 146-33]
MDSLKRQIKQIFHRIRYVVTTALIYRQRFFFVGLAATGNRTAGKAMTLLGYSWKHYPRSYESLWQFHAVTDAPVAFWFRQKKLPKNGLYILTTRSLKPWLEDCQAWFESRPSDTLSPFEIEIREALYGGVTFDRQRFAEAYDRHTAACYQIAQEMGVTLYEWDLVANPTWDFLTQLTGRTSDQAFPFTPGVYNRTWQAVIEAEEKAKSSFI